MNQKQTKTSTNMQVFVSFVGIVLLLLGIYSSLRMLFNLVYYEKYPTSGTISFVSLLTPMMGSPMYGQREEDCSYPQPYFDYEGKQRSATTEESENQKKQEELCLSGIREARENVKVNDISTSVLLLFLGTGILITKKFFI